MVKFRKKTYRKLNKKSIRSIKGGAQYHCYEGPRRKERRRRRSITDNALIDPPQKWGRQIPSPKDLGLPMGSSEEGPMELSTPNRPSSKRGPESSGRKKDGTKRKDTRQSPGSTRQSPGSTMSSPGRTRQRPGSTMSSPGSTMSSPGRVDQATRPKPATPAQVRQQRLSVNRLSGAASSSRGTSAAHKEHPPLRAFTEREISGLMGFKQEAASAEDLGADADDASLGGTKRKRKNKKKKSRKARASKKNKKKKTRKARGIIDDLRTLCTTGRCGSPRPQRPTLRELALTIERNMIDDFKTKSPEETLTAKDRRNIKALANHEAERRVNTSSRGASKKNKKKKKRNL